MTTKRKWSKKQLGSDSQTLSTGVPFYRFVQSSRTTSI